MSGYLLICVHLLLLISLFIPWRSLQAQTDSILVVGNFSKAGPARDLPEGWQPLHFQKIERRTRYTLVEDEGTVVVKAVSDASASGLIREMRIDPREFPIVQWRWKVANILRKGNIREREGDDYPARIYIAFEYDPAKLNFFERIPYNTHRVIYGKYPPQGAINYIWESSAPKGTIVPNPFTARVKMIVVESGAERLNQWVMEERNIVEDYGKAFGGEPPMISGVAIMTDSDNTGEWATAYYGDIAFKKKPGKQE